ncbi:putative glycolipid-binding domain-containing protein [Streptomyces sp. NPDC002133]|uniref:putative glycolipid-binding domain-containing protein n=1 Tax=Streptomyces sp. NPDC002133 TaxID=3154409 RepID=UPI003330F634
MRFTLLPATAAWQHRDARSGFEVAFFHAPDADGRLVEGYTTAVESGEAFAVEYRIRLDAAGRTRTAHVRGRSSAGARTTLLEAGGEGHWLVDGARAPWLDGCLDVDLESSAMTNALPVRRMELPVGARAEAPASYVRALGLGVERLDQTYVRRSDDGSRECYDYSAPAFTFGCRLGHDEPGLPVDYPGIAVRVG